MTPVFPVVVIGKLTLVKAVDVDYWRVRCACGQRFTVHVGSARQSAKKSGGRFPRCKRCSCDELLRKYPKHSKREQAVWRSLRFHHKTRPIPAAWRKSFMAFYEDVGPCPRGYEMTHADTAKPHGPGNTIWRPHAEARGLRRGTFVVAQGRRLTLSGWARVRRCSREMFRLRIKAGWDPVRAVTTSVKRYRARA
mgnify:CR=1 FL=1